MFNGKKNEVKVNNTVEKRVISYLYGKEIKPGIKGFKYLITAIMKCLDDGAHLDRICNLYEEISDEYLETPDRVERAIRHAISKSNRVETNGDFIARAYYELKYTN